MIHELSHSLKKQSKDGFLFPNYNKNCISNIPGTILELFGIKTRQSKLPIKIENEFEDFNKLVLFVLDGFGYNQFLRSHKEHKFLSNLTENSDIFPLTSVFPSQTTNALTTLNTGLTPQEHGLFEYYLYLKEVDKIVNTLHFEPIGSRYRDELIEKGFNPNLLFKGKTIQDIFKEVNIKTYVHIYIAYAYSHYSSIFFDGSTVVPTLKSSDLIIKLRKNLEKERGSAYFFVHLSNLDTIAHEYGPKSYEYSTELSVISYLLNRELVEKINQKNAKETLFLLVSDHGGIDVAPEKTIYLNQFPDLIKNLQNGRDGKHIFPTGSPRDVFLHVKKEKLDKTMKLLEQKIGDKAKIMETSDAIKIGIFGKGNIKQEFSDRVGDLLILPYRNETIWFEHILGKRYNPLGHHGGLNKEEMLVPLSIAKLNHLK